MIVVDSSVWIDHLRDQETGQVVVLRRLLRGEMVGPILVGDIVMYEILAGLRSAEAAREIRERLETLLLVSMVDFDLVERAVAHCHALRRRGITPGTVDMIIATYCIETGVELLTADRDFVPMRDHLGLRLTEEV
ncbi:MAG TPA: PIN domain-containing protein [Geminicoccaceae bacterium]|nr:PIN domain-containing protein [Geminicoccaceae bacterium]